jgi:hypothetical protein
MSFGDETIRTGLPAGRFGDSTMSTDPDRKFVYAVAILGTTLIVGGGFLLVQDWPSNVTDPGALGLVTTGSALIWWVYLRAIRLPRLKSGSD